VAVLNLPTTKLPVFVHQGKARRMPFIPAPTKSSQSGNHTRAGHVEHLQRWALTVTDQRQTKSRAPSLRVSSNASVVAPRRF
jgi:hypothetical protein